MAARRLDRLLIIDAMSLLFRAFHAVPARFAVFDSQGQREHTNAIYGFTTQMLRAIDDWDPTHLVVAFDAPGPTFRDAIDANYKANRSAPPPELIPQFGRARQLVEALGIPAYQHEGFEADDIIGTIAKTAAGENFHVRIYSGDRDLFQLITSRINVFYPRPGSMPNLLYDRERFIKRWQVEPRYLVDIKALQGDSSDNIPGVPGIGEKTAITLIRDHRNLEGVLAAIEDLPSRARRALAEPENQESAQISKRLATIDTGVPVEFDAPRSRIWEHADPVRVREIFDQLDFNSIRQRLPFDLELHAQGQFSLFAAGPQSQDWTAVDGAAAAAKLATQLIAGSETPSLIGWATGGKSKLRLASLAIHLDHHNWYIADANRSILEALAPWLGDSAKPKRVFAGKELIRALLAAGIGLAGIDFDAATAAHLDSGGESVGDLRQLVARQVDQVLANSLPTGDGVVSMAEAAALDPQACIRAAQAVAQMADRLGPSLANQELSSVYQDIELPLIPVLAQMESVGVQLEKSVLVELEADLEVDHARIAEQIHELADRKFNINSTRELGRVLFEDLGLEAKLKTRGGAPSTARRALDLLLDEHPIIAAVIEHRELATLLRNYIGPLPTLVDANGRIHPRYSQTASVTGRLASRNPNLQAIPVRRGRGRKIRHAFTAAPGRTLISADYSQIDLRVLAHISGDENLIAAFKADLDIHQATASQLYGVDPAAVSEQMREHAKMVNFGIVYGITAHGLAWRGGLEYADAKEMIDSYFRRYPGVHNYMEETARSAREEGFTRTLHGRIRRHADLQSFGRRREAAEREAINMPIQGTTAEIIKLAMIELDRYIRDQQIPAAMTLQIHDELLIEIDAAVLTDFAPQLARIMNGVCQLAVPLKTDVAAGPNWAQTKPVALN